MIALPNMLAMRGDVVQNPRLVLRLLDSLRVEASDTMSEVLDGASHKRIKTADVPGVGPTFVSRCTNNGDCNPLWKIAGLLVLMKRLGMGRERAQRMVDWLQDLIDAIWPESEAEDFEGVMVEEQELDAADDGPQMRAMCGDADALRDFIRVKERQRAHDTKVIRSSKRHLSTLTAGH